MMKMDVLSMSSKLGRWVLPLYAVVGSAVIIVLSLLADDGITSAGVSAIAFLVGLAVLDIAARCLKK